MQIIIIDSNAVNKTYLIELQYILIRLKQSQIITLAVLKKYNNSRNQYK
jgi:hypothetical protein